MPKIIPNRDERITEMAAQGLHKAEIARKLGCTTTVIYDWSKLRPEVHFKNGSFGQNALRGDRFEESRCRRLGIYKSEIDDLRTLINKGRYSEAEAIEMIRSWRTPRRLTCKPPRNTAAQALQ